MEGGKLKLGLMILLLALTVLMLYLLLQPQQQQVRVDLHVGLMGYVGLMGLEGTVESIKSFTNWQIKYPDPDKIGEGKPTVRHRVNIEVTFPKEHAGKRISFFYTQSQSYETPPRTGGRVLMEGWQGDDGRLYIKNALWWDTDTNK